MELSQRSSSMSMGNSSTPLSVNPTQNMSDQNNEVARSAIPRNLYIHKNPPEVLPGRLRDRSKTFTVNKDLRANLAETYGKGNGMDDEVEPTSFKEAMKRPDLWTPSMDEEMESFEKNEVAELVNRPKNANVVGNKWVYKNKKNAKGEIVRRRARLCAKGFTQSFGLDYFETFAPVIAMIILRLLLAFASVKGLIMKGFDIKAAFLYGWLDEDVYMEQPEGYSDGTNRVWKLKKSLYGLKQAPRQWNIEFSNFLKSLGFTESKFDRCVYYRLRPSIAIIAIYVDDGLIFAKEQADIDRIMKALHERFDVHETDTTTFLGFQIERSADKHKIGIHQGSYVNNVLNKFNMSDSKPIENPSTITRDNKNKLDDSTLDPKIPYREAIGSLMYASTTTRVDIAYAVNRASRKVSEPTNLDWKDVKRIMRYLNDNENPYICYSKEANKGLYAYCDSDFAGDSTNKSTTGYIIMFAGGPIHWKSQRQSIVSLSSTESELIALCELAKEIIFLKEIAKELGIIDDSPIIIFCDNTSAIKLAQNEKSVQRTRHMGVRAAYLREMITNGEIEIRHISTDYNLADMLTKPLTTNRFTYLRSKLMYIMSIIMMLSIICLGGDSLPNELHRSQQSASLEVTKPIIWIPTDNYVDVGITEYIVDYTVINPCESLRVKMQNEVRNNMAKRQMPNLIPKQQSAQPQQIPVMQPNILLSNDELLVARTIEECNQMFTQVYGAKLDELLLKSNTKQLQYGPKMISKRGLIDNTVEKAAEIVECACVSNLISTIISYINPYSTRNKLNNLEEQVAHQQERIEDFNRNFNITYGIQQGIIDSMVALSRDLHETRRQLTHLANLMPKFTWISAYMQSRITSSASDLRTIIEEFNYGRVATRELRYLFKLDSLEGINNHDTTFESVTKIATNIIRFKFAVREKSRTTFVYKVAAFQYWDNLTALPSLMEYQGDRFLIFNETNNCIKAINEPTQTAVLDECTEANFTDPRLQNWRSIISTEDIYSVKNTCQVKRTLLFNYIYCFPENITLKTGEHKLPPNVVRLPVSEPFKIPIMNYKPIVRKINITNEHEYAAIDSIHIGHFPMGSDATDQTKWFQEIQRLRKLNQQLKIREEKNVSVERGGIIWWTLISLFVLMTAATIALITYNIYSSDKRHRRLTRDIVELKSNYAEVKIDCPNCSHNDQLKNTFTSNKTATHTEKQKIEVGKDESITINLNRVLPELPASAVNGEQKQVGRVHNL